MAPRCFDRVDLHMAPQAPRSSFQRGVIRAADPRHRALRHHAEGIFIFETLFGATIVNAGGRIVPVRLIGEQHVREDLGSIPSFADWARLITPQTWMLRGHRLDETFDGNEADATPGGVVSRAGLRGGENRSVRIAI
jgi:hypothetical protein